MPSVTPNIKEPVPVIRLIYDPVYRVMITPQANEITIEISFWLAPTDSIANPAHIRLEWQNPYFQFKENRQTSLENFFPMISNGDNRKVRFGVVYNGAPPPPGSVIMKVYARDADPATQERADTCTFIVEAVPALSHNFKRAYQLIMTYPNDKI